MLKYFDWRGVSSYEAVDLLTAGLLAFSIPFDLPLLGTAVTGWTRGRFFFLAASLLVARERVEEAVRLFYETGPHHGRICAAGLANAVRILLYCGLGWHGMALLECALPVLVLCVAWREASRS